jgi:hypothetical protein
VRSREVRILMVECLVWKKNRECERVEGERDTHEGLKIEGHQHHWCPTVYCGMPTSTCTQRALRSLTPFNEPRAPSSLAPLTGSRYGISFPRGLSVKIVF